MIAIRTIQLDKSYHFYQVLKEVSLEVAEGECYALFGSNGAGKTTLLRILATVLHPSAGKFELMGYDGLQEKLKVREILFLMGHGSYHYDELNALENIRFAMALRGMNPTGREIKLVLDRVGIGAFADLRTRYYSMGMKKRLSIAKAMLIRPSVLLLDEPYASLDEEGMNIINHYIQDITQTAVMLTTHDRLRSSQVAHRAGVLNRGELTEIAVKELAGRNDLF
jgi:ABC-type multidrug transport system ATPase subunit